MARGFGFALSHLASDCRRRRPRPAISFWRAHRHVVIIWSMSRDCKIEFVVVTFLVRSRGNASLFRKTLIVLHIFKGSTPVL
jgi:hypothetical protein